jgi:hypothetical protein
MLRAYAFTLSTSYAIRSCSKTSFESIVEILGTPIIRVSSKLIVLYYISYNLKLTLTQAFFEITFEDYKLKKDTTSQTEVMPVFISSTKNQ